MASTKDEVNQPPFNGGADQKSLTESKDEKYMGLEPVVATAAGQSIGMILRSSRFRSFGITDASVAATIGTSPWDDRTKKQRRVVGSFTTGPFYPPLKLLPARQVYKEFIYAGAKIPKGVLIYVNTQAVNFGKCFFRKSHSNFC